MVLLERAKSEIERWGKYDKGLGNGEIKLLQALLDKDYLLQLPCSKKVHKQDTPSGLRHLFYHHVAGILGWKERVPEGDESGISTLLYALVREIWPNSENGSNKKHDFNTINKNRSEDGRELFAGYEPGTARRSRGTTRRFCRPSGSRFSSSSRSTHKSDQGRCGTEAESAIALPTCTNVVIAGQDKESAADVEGGHIFHATDGISGSHNSEGKFEGDEPKSGNICEVADGIRGITKSSDIAESKFTYVSRYVPVIVDSIVCTQGHEMCDGTLHPV